LYRITAKGKAKSPDKNFDPNSTLIEDRIVLFQAASVDDTIAQAVKEARIYCNLKMVNIYGQRVGIKRLKVCDAYEIIEPKPTAGVEVYSSTDVFRASASDSSLIERRLGTASANLKARYKFMDGPILRALREAGLDRL
jgi:hypothetical protein